MPFTLIAAILLATLAVPPAAGAGPVDGPAQAVDGDTLVVGDRKVRLFGIDAPELDQTCERSGRTWACGAAAKQMLAGLLSAGPVSCLVRDVDRYGR